MTEIYIIMEYAGMGTGMKPVCAYCSRWSADEHINLLKKLAPETASKFTVLTLQVREHPLDYQATGGGDI